MPPSIPDDLMARVLAGEASAEEVARVEAWAAESPVHRRELERLRAGFVPRGTAGAWDLDRAWSKVAGQIEASHAPAEVIPIPAAPRWPTTLLRLAAAVVVVVGATLAWQRLRTPAAPMVYASAAGQRLEVPLADGSRAVLAPRSTLTVPADYPERRELRLEGEGWFEVVHDDRRAFEVVAGGFTVRDVGTVFTIDGRRAATITVTVVEGEVLVLDRNGTLADASLSAGEVGRFTAAAFGREGRAVVSSDAPVADLAAWHAGSLVLVDVPVPEVLDRLAAWYGVAFRLADSGLGGGTITATLPLDSIDEAGSVLALLLGAEPSRDSTGVTFR